MAQAFRTTEILSGYFDCRVFKNGTPKDQRPMKQDGDTVALTFGFSEYPKLFADAGGAEFIREVDVNGAKRWYVGVKVGRICRFFDKDGRPITRPTNAELDGKRWDVQMQFKALHGDASKMEARGFWADAIQMKPAEEITFAPMGGQPAAVTTQTEPITDDDLPF